MTDPAPRRRPSRAAGTAFAWTVGAVLAVAVLAVAWVGVRGWLAYGHLRDAQDSVAAASASIDDPAAAAALLGGVGDDTSAARSLTSDPVWRAAETVPWVGPQLAAVARLAAAIDDVAADALGPLSEAASGLSADALRPVDGAFDVARIAALEPAAGAAATALAGASDDLAGIDERPLLGVVREAVGQARDLVSEASVSADALHRATRIVPAILGANGPRTYLVAFQNNAEWRSMGGIVGAVAQIDTENGRISLGAQGSSGDFRAPAPDDPVVALPEDTLRIFGTRPARFIQNVTQLPDFTMGAPIAREMWLRETGTAVDGVIALDPVSLSYILRATGPITLPTGDVITSDNAVSLLLDEVYRRYEVPAQQDAFFQSAAASVFQALADGRADPAALIDALTEAGEQRRLLMWSADAAEQAVLDGTTLQGALPVSDADRTAFGVYLNDGTGSKMDYYLHVDVETAWCGADAASLRVTLRNDAPDPATLPAYVTGGGGFGVPEGQALTGVYVYLPEGAVLQDQRLSSAGSAASATTDTDRGHGVVKWSVQLAPGQQAELLLRAGTPATAELDALLTPTVYANETSRVGVGCGFPE
ncbi:DUF4012 domain-containing protein [Microbacterium sp. LMI1-1-1.1]|uniref:DUF4012 domain-containing protein n=1 Tax=Microbacterium sp. LMI1-1-1.1 TaxID=3135223 RepID=UPI0034679880